MTPPEISSKVLNAAEARLTRGVENAYGRPQASEDCLQVSSMFSGTVPRDVYYEDLNLLLGNDD